MADEKKKETLKERWWRFEIALHTARPSWSATFLIAVLLSAFDFSYLHLFAVLIGYSVLHFIDHMQKLKALDAIMRDEFYWNPDPDNAESEVSPSGNLVRGKLPWEHQEIVNRLGHVIRRMTQVG
jgi:hypothetical protein